MTHGYGAYVHKYGGTSVGSVERIEAVADKLKKFKDDGHDLVVVVSAMSGETNRLVALASEMSERPNPREMDVLLSTGEQVTIALLSMALEERGYTRQKFFPAVAAGGPGVLKAFSSPLAGVVFCPTGGIRAHTAAEWLALPNVACVGGSWVAPKDAVAAGDWARVTALSKAAAALG